MFDVFSALTDSRAGGSAHLQSVATRAGWMVSGADLYDRWDSLNKECHRAAIHWVPFGDLSVMAMQTALSELALPNEDAIRISRTLLESMAEWPLWPGSARRGSVSYQTLMTTSLRAPPSCDWASSTRSSS